MKKYFPVLQYVNIPNIITTLGLVFGILASYYIVRGNFTEVVIALFFATSMDLIDGFFAGKLNQGTKFGQYVDSLVDFFICCIIPVWMALVFIGQYPITTAALVFFCIAGLWRLAYYNVVEDTGYFTGLPVPGGGMLTIVTIWAAYQHSLPLWAAAAVFFAVGLLMVSYIRLKKYGLWQKALGVLGLVFLAVVIFL